MTGLMGRSWRFCLLILVFGTLTGCSLRKFFASKLDWVILYQLDSYFDLEDPQEKILKPQIKQAVAYLRKEKSEALLTAVRDLIRQADQKKLEDNAVESFVSRIDAVRKDQEPVLLQPLLAMALSLNDDQIKHFEKKLKKGNEDLEEILEEDEADFADEAEKRGKRRIKNLENIYGKLNDDQKKLLAPTLTPTREQLQQQLSARKTLHAFLISTLRSKNKGAIEKALRDWFQTGELSVDPGYVSYRKTSAQRWMQAFRSLNRTLTDDQWKTLKERLKEVEDDVLQFQRG